MLHSIDVESAKYPTSEPSWRSAIADAVVWGLVRGVKYGVALLIILSALALWVGDYQVTRGRALNGQLAYEALVRQQQQQVATKPAGK